MEWVLHDAIFSKICDLNTITYEIIYEFIKNYICKCPDKGILLKNLSNIYVLYGMQNSDNYVKSTEKKWKDILNDEQYEIMQKNNYYILGFILIDKKKSKNDKVHYIGLIDTRVKGYNIAELMINKYEKSYENIKLLPYEIIETSTKYWQKYFGNYFSTKEEYHKFIIDMKINDDNIKWDYLIELL